jgi:hypothetical protein
MISHIVLLSFKSEFSETEIKIKLDHLKNLMNIIPEIKSFTCGANNSPENLNKGFTHGFTMTFENSKDRDIYLRHKDHRKIAEEIIVPALKEGINSAIVFDYES